MVAERYPKNYYAWTHRSYCMRKAQLPLLQEEWNFVLAWIPKHVSDHSAVHYGGQVLLKMVQVSNNRVEVMELIQNGMQEGKRLVDVHPAHEVLWIFRRVCARAMLLLLDESNQATDGATREFFISHMENEWIEIQQSKRPKIGSELELEWRKTHVYRLSYIVWVARKCHLVRDYIQEQGTQALRECDFIPYELWRIKDTGLS